MAYQTKLNAKYMPVLQCISSFEGTSYIKLHDTTIQPILLFLVVLL